MTKVTQYCPLLLLGGISNSLARDLFCCSGQNSTLLAIQQLVLVIWSPVPLLWQLWCLVTVFPVCDQNGVETFYKWINNYLCCKDRIWDVIPDFSKKEIRRCNFYANEVLIKVLFSYTAKDFLELYRNVYSDRSWCECAFIAI